MAKDPSSKTVIMAHLMLRTGAGAVWPLKNDL
jgi:hypothetical protein